MLRTAIFNDGENFRHNICGLFAGPSGAPFDPARDLFDRRNYLPRADWEGFFGHLVKESQIQEIPTYMTRAYWYVTGAVDAWPWKFPKVVENPSASNTAEIAEWHRKNLGHIQELVEFDRTKNSNPIGLSAQLEGMPNILGELRRRKLAIENRFRGFATVQNKIALAHDRIEFRRSGGIRYNLFTDGLGQEKTTDVNLAVDMMRLKDIYDIAVIVSGDQDFVPVAAAVKDLGKRVVNVSFKTKSGKLLPTGAWRLNVAVDQSIVVDYDTFRRFMFPDIQQLSGR